MRLLKALMKGLKECAEVKTRARVAHYSLANFSRQASLTQPEKDCSSFLACNCICSSRVSSNLIVCLVLFNRSFLLFCFFSCIGAVQYDRFNVDGTVHYKCENHKKAMPRSAGTLSRHLTKPLNGVMIMANRYDNAFLYPKQIKLFKFYDFSINQIIETTAVTEQLARDNLGKSSLIFVARKHICPMTQQINMLGEIKHA